MPLNKKRKKEKEKQMKNVKQDMMMDPYLPVVRSVIPPPFSVFPS